LKRDPNNPVCAAYCPNFGTLNELAALTEVLGVTMNVATLSPSVQTPLLLRILYFEDLLVGMTETLSKTFSSADVVGFAELTGDRNPIHLSEHFAAKTPFGRRIAHGLYTASLISAVIGTRLPGPGAVYMSQSLNFRAPVNIGDTVDATVTVAALIPERQRATLTCICRVGAEIVLEGDALVKVPSMAKSKRPLPIATVALPPKTTA
jgi:3-hydroxybutyryl-CoA dehydratase